MKQEDKELLLRDLCARLPYKVIVEFISYEGDTSPWFGKLSCKDLDCFIHDVEYIEIKPYLRPLSSMSVEHRCKVQNLLPDNCEISFKNQKITFYGECNNIQLEQLEKVFNFFNLFHFDYRGLIEKGLALEAPKEMYN